MENERKLASIRKIESIDPIDGADAIDVATIDGWKVVVKKNEFNVGDLCVYFEIDSWIPESIAPFLYKGRGYKGILGERLRTVKLRGQISQGLAMPMSSFFGKNGDQWVHSSYGGTYIVEEGSDVTEELGVLKWEMEIPTQLRGTVRGNFPSFIRKTDQERIQNLKKSLNKWVNDNHRWEVTEKLDGSSMTVYYNNGDFGVCSRNLSLKETTDNAYWTVANRFLMKERMGQLGKNIAIQGELIGVGVQGNKYGLDHLRYYVFDVYDIDQACYVDSDVRYRIVEELGLLQVPIINVGSTLSELYCRFVENILTFADGPSIISGKVLREGLVFKRTDGVESFKAISNKWLLKHES